jgi:hypothetical protein
MTCVNGRIGFCPCGAGLGSGEGEEAMSDMLAGVPST